MDTSSDITQFGWVVEAAQDGVRIQRSRSWRAGAVGCSFATLLFIAPFAAVGWFVASWFLDVPEKGWFGIAMLLVPLGVLGIISLLIAAALIQFLSFLLLRDRWQASHNRLLVRRTLLGLGPTREYVGGKLVIEPDYGMDRRDPQWRLYVITAGQRRCLLQDPIVSASIGDASPEGTVSELEAIAVADVLSQHTEWPVTIAEPPRLEAAPISEQGRLPPPLHNRGFRIKLDGRLRQVVRPPKRGNYLGALFLMGFGAFAFCMAAAAVNSFLDYANESEQPAWDPTFWIFVVPLVLVGSGLILLGLIVLLSRELWILDRNLLTIASSLFGWRSDRQYVDGRLVAARVRVNRPSAESSGTAWEWQLQLQDTSGHTVRVLDRHSDNDSPRLLGQLLANGTGWPLREAD